MSESPRYIKLLPIALLYILLTSNISFALTNNSSAAANDDVASVESKDTNNAALESLKNTAYIKNLLRMFKGWTDLNTITPSEYFKVIYGDLKTIDQVGQLKARELNVPYITYNATSPYTSSREKELTSFFQTNTQLNSNQPAIINVQFGVYAKIYFEEYWNLYTAFSKLKNPNNKVMIISIDKYYNFKSIATKPHDVHRYTGYDNLVKLVSTYTIMDPNFGERKELISILTKGYKFNKETNIDVLGLITHGYSFSDLFNFAQELKKIAKDKSINPIDIRMVQEAFKIKPKIDAAIIESPPPPKHHFF